MQIFLFKKKIINKAKAMNSADEAYPLKWLIFVVCTNCYKSAIISMNLFSVPYE